MATPRGARRIWRLASGVSQAASIASGRAPGRGWLLSAGTPVSVRSDQTRPSSEYPRQRQGMKDRPQTPSPSKDHPRRTMPRCCFTFRRGTSSHLRLRRFQISSECKKPVAGACPPEGRKAGGFIGLQGFLIRPCFPPGGRQPPPPAKKIGDLHKKLSPPISP